MERVLGLKIDVDTYRGMQIGVPRLLDMLGSEGIRATFFLSIGPDASGRALLQILKNPRFLRKMVRTRAGSLYGWRTALYGTLLPSPLIALSFPELVRQIVAAGHEVQFHAWDHRRWQDDLTRQPAAWIQEWFRKGIEGYEHLTGRRPSAFGAPAWLIDERVLSLIARYRFAYLSCTRASAPFIHHGTDFVEIPSDLACFEEIGFDASDGPLLAALEPGGMHVLPVHAEVEGGIMAGRFTGLLRAVKHQGYRFLPLGEILPLLDRSRLPSRRFALRLLPGRSAVCAV